MLKQKGTKENKCKTKYRGKEIIEQLVLEAKKYLQKRKKKKKHFNLFRLPIRTKQEGWRLNKSPTSLRQVMLGEDC